MLDSECGRQFRGIEHGDAPARSRAGVEEMPSMGETFGDLFDGVGDSIGFRRHGSDHACVFLLDQPDDLSRAGTIDVEAGLEAVLAHGPGKISSGFNGRAMPTLMQKIRLALKGWSRRREAA